MRKTTFVSGIVVAAICVCMLFQYRESREDNEGKEGFTQLQPFCGLPGLY